MGYFTTINDGRTESGSRFERSYSNGKKERVEPRITTLGKDPELVRLFAEENPDSLVWRLYDENETLLSERPFVE